jgi:putative transposase
MEQIGRRRRRRLGVVFIPADMCCTIATRSFCASFRSVLASGGVKTIVLPAKSPNLNAFAERWVRSVKQECLSKLILFGEGSLSRVLTEYSRHYHHERNHQGKGNRLLFPGGTDRRYPPGRNIACHQRLGGILKYYQRAA